MHKQCIVQFLSSGTIAVVCRRKSFMSRVPHFQSIITLLLSGSRKGVILHFRCKVSKVVSYCKITDAFLEDAFETTKFTRPQLRTGDAACELPVKIRAREQSGYGYEACAMALATVLREYTVSSHN